MKFNIVLWHSMGFGNFRIKALKIPLILLGGDAIEIQVFLTSQCYLRNIAEYLLYVSILRKDRCFLGILQVSFF